MGGLDFRSSILSTIARNSQRTQIEGFLYKNKVERFGMRFLFRRWNSYHLGPRKIVRLQMVMANTLFECVSYHPEEYQILTSGTDRKVAYWETYDGSQIRELDGSDSGGINGLDIDRNGKFFVTGGVDTILKVWDYHAGEEKYRGIGHADAITKVKISPN